VRYDAASRSRVLRGRRRARGWRMRHHVPPSPKMKYSVKNVPAARQRTGCAVVGVFDRRTLSAPAAALDKAARGALDRALKRGELDGRAGQTLMLHNLSHV